MVVPAAVLSRRNTLRPLIMKKQTVVEGVSHADLQSDECSKTVQGLSGNMILVKAATGFPRFLFTCKGP